METSTHPRRWRVVLPDGSVTEVDAMKLVITTSGALLFVDFDREPRRVFRLWVSCEEISKGRR